MPTIKDIKEQYPAYKDVDDTVLADALYTKFYSGKIEKNDFLAQVGLDFEGNEFTRGVGRGVDTTKALVSEGVPGVAKGLVNDTLNALGFDSQHETEKNLQEYQQKVEQAYKKNPTNVPSFKDIDSVGDVGSFVAATAGEQIPQLGLSLLGGGVGGTLTKQGVQQLAKRGGSSLTKAQIDKSLKKGILAGTLSTSATQTIPESYFNLLEKGEDEATTSIVLGSLKAGLDVIPQIKILEKVLGPKAADVVADSLVKRIGVEGSKAAVGEGLTETAQEGVDIIAEQFILDNQELFSPENIDRLIESGLKGAIGGGFFGAGAAPFMQSNDTNFEYDNLSPKQKEKLDTKFAEDVVGDAVKTTVVADDAAAPLDDSMIVPLYTDDVTVEQAKALGVQPESLTFISPEQVDDTKRVVETISIPTTTSLNTVYQSPSVLQAQKDKAVTPALEVRQAALKEGNRTDQDFFPGDGEITVGVPVNPTSTLTNTQSELKVPDTQVLEQAAEKRTPLPASPTLPKNLSTSNTNYQQSPLKFASDLDRAAYIISNPKKTAAKRKQFVDWATNLTGMSEKDIVNEGLVLRKKVKDLANKREKNTSSIFVPATIEQVKLQRLNLPKHGNLRDDLVVPTIVHNSLKGLELTPKGKEKHNSLIGQAQRIVKEVGGKAINMAPFDTLTDYQNNPVAGAQYMNTVFVALNQQGKVNETAYHETYHALENMGVFTEKEIEVLEAATPQLLQYADEDGYLRGQDFQVLLATPIGRQELRANAFGKWAVEQQENTSNKSFPSKVKASFRKALNVIQKIGNAYKGLGFKTLDDIFTDVLNGKKAVDTLDTINYNTRVARYQKIGEEFQKAHQQELHGDEHFKNLMQEGVRHQNSKFDTGKQMGWYGRYIRSMHDAAQQFPALAPIYAAFDRRNKNSSFLMTKYVDLLGDFTNLDKGMRHRLHEIGKYTRKTKQKAVLDEEGRLTFERDGKIVRINDPEIGRQYMQMQKAYKEVLHDRFAQLKEEAYSEFSEVLPSAEFGIEDARAAVAVVEDPKTKERLENLVEALMGYEKMKAVDYVPALRFGDWGITVRDTTTNEQVAFYAIENGDPLTKDKYNKFQLEKTLEEINAKYSDLEAFEVIGDKGRIKDFSSTDNLVPFVLNRNAYLNKVDSRFLNFEMLGGILNKKDMDKEAYDAVKQKVYNDILNRGFKRHFLEAEFLDGHSDDWNRVQHAYLSSAAHHLASVPFQKDLTAIDKQLDKLKDNRLKARARSFIDYNNSPAEDLIALRTFNFLWTMGGNLSTAALQIMTLPTTTLGGMAQLSPNPVKNMALIGKWFGLGVGMAPDGLVAAKDNEGIVHLAFDDKDKLQEMVDKGQITTFMATTIERLYKEGKIRGLLTEESIGSRQFETRSLTGKAREGFHTTANYLGLPITVMEQLTRFATTMSMYELLETNPEARKRAKEIYGTNPLFQAKLKMEPNKSFIEHVAEMQMDEAHAVFGKLGRPEFMRHVGGALFFPFMTYPQQAIEFMVRMMGRGKDGRRGAYTSLTALFLFSGLMGLPGGELLKELLEELEKQVTGSEEDFDLLIREKVYEATGDAKFAKFVTQGLGRAYGGLDVSRRIGLPIPGQDVLLNVLGLRGGTSDMLGVSGSLLTSMGEAWNEYNNGGGTAKVLSSMLPVAPANYLKALNYSQEGVKTRRGMQLVTPEEITAKTIAGRAFGVTSDQIATKREEQYLSQLLGKKHTTAVERFRNKAKNINTKMRRAQKRQDFKEAKALQEDLRGVIMDLKDYVRKEEIPFDVKSFIRSVTQATSQRLNAKISPKDVRKIGRKELPKMQEVLGIE